LPGSTTMTVSTGVATIPGVQTFTIRLRLRGVHGREATREKIVAAYVWPEVSVPQTSLRLTPASGGFVLDLRPCDRFGTLLGPGWAASLAISGEGVQVAGAPQDMGDGTYRTVVSFSHEI